MGLVRHFKVERGYPNKWVTSEELMKWASEYDESDVIEGEINLGNIDWQRCYSSDLRRAMKTATKAYSDKIIYLKELREITLSPVMRWDIKLPVFIHLVLIRIAWLLGHASQGDTKENVIQRLDVLLDKVEQSDENVLIIGHGGIMIFMSRELKKRGFIGPKLKRPANGKLYVYERI
ncbi:histidine phosphatase family protein [Alkalihalobacillus sp. MEB130]|uniref:histidine phosphatase family protein n=1 Tax=Alkalihalobacillus sp. MEB130 TaxID=2976704 RepID=UPI0028DFC6F8|nr:histidine phosphatase family protein [Alkalihalobacillus sp. MEB130]MDT8859714.1 histidine phosphatase family protein [Alkalihalobacillus sp. MEB130]